MTPYYEHAGITIYHGDCREVLPTLAGVAVVVTDPPYGMNYRRNGHDYSTGHYKPRTTKLTRQAVIGDSGPFDPAPWIQWPCVFTGAQWFYDRLPPGGVIHTWDKRGTYQQIDQADVDQIWCSVRSPARKFECVWRGLCRQVEHADPILHPTQKPVMLMQWMISLIKGEAVLDPFMGSGTTLVAAKRLGRRAIGIEIEERYCEIAARRLSQEVLPLEPSDDNSDDEWEDDTARSCIRCCLRDSLCACDAG